MFAWLDQSEEQRRKVLDVIDLFKEHGTVDELGFGTIRDAFADILFPGTSNLMSRAAYFLFVPWMYQRLERQKAPSAEFGAKARREELKLIERLLESGETEGVIGRRARGGLRRLPSTLYWAGMKRLGISSIDGSPDAYHRGIDRFFARLRGGTKNDDGERLEGAASNWHQRLPPPPPDWPATARFRLNKMQAEFLRDQIVLAAPTSLFALLVRADNAPTDVEFPWAHPDVAMFPAQITWQLHHARNFSELLHGAALLYNLILSELTRNEERVTHYRDWLGEWVEMVGQRIELLRGWDRQDAWRCLESEGARVPRPTRDFVDRWCEMALDMNPTAIADIEAARVLVAQRERRLKGPLARVENKRAQELWQGASSTGRSDYRWSNASVIVEDIIAGIGGEQNA